MAEISTSILSVEEENSIKTFYNLEEAKTDYFHIDVMDGEFVENNTYKKMLKFCANIKQISNLPLDVHLMVKDIKKYIEDYTNFEPSIITFHIEEMKTKDQTMELIKLIRENGIKPAIAISPDTPVESILEYLPYIHMVLVMTVIPGKGGQKLIPDTIVKIKKIKEYIEQNNLDTYIEADGGINEENAKMLKEAGVDIIVAGSSIINSKNYKETINNLKK